MPFSPPPNHLDPDDKRTHLLMVFTRTPFAPFAVPDPTGGSRLNEFPMDPGIYGLYLNDRPLLEVLTPEQLQTPLTDEALVAYGLTSYISVRCR